MTNTFSFQRLFQLIRKQWFENSRMYFFAALALLALQVLMFAFWATVTGPHYSEDGVYIIFLLGFFVSGGIFASMSFSMLADKTKGGYWLSFPASHLEKLLCVIFYSTIFFTVVYCLTFFLAKSAALAYVNDLIESNPAKYSFKALESNDGFWDVFSFLTYAFFAVQAFYVLGSVYFPRYAFVITTIIGTSILFLFLYYAANLFFNILPDYRWAGGYVDSAPQQIGGAFFMKRYSLPPLAYDILCFLLKFIWAPVFWLVTWYRLKEKQI